MPTTRAAAVLDTLVSTLAAVPALTGRVWDGPPVTGDPLPEVVTVGYAFDDDDDTAVDIRQEYHDLGPAAKRDETLDVLCAAYAANGDGDMAAARARAVTLLGAVETALRANPGLGLADALRTELTVGTMRQAQTAQGTACIVQFTVTATCLI